MTKEEFYEAFTPLAIFYFNKEEKVKLLSKTYFELIKDFDLPIFRDVMLDISQKSPKFFPAPAEIQSMCISGRAKITAQNMSHDSDLISLEEARKPSNVAARKEFYDTLMNACKKKEKEGTGDCVGMVHVLHCLGEELVAAPIERMRVLNKREAV